MDREQSSSPADWKKYADSSELKEIPLKSYHDANMATGTLTMRDVYLEYPQSGVDGLDKVQAFAEILAFLPRTPIDLSRSVITRLCARVLTAGSDVTLEFIPAKRQDCTFCIYADTQDCKISYVVKGTDHGGSLNWTPKPGDKEKLVGVEITFATGNNKPHIEYLKDYGDAIPHSQLYKSLETQLRVASVLFWTAPAIAISQTSYIATVTSLSDGLGMMNLQAVTLGQQLTAQTVTGPNTSYAPILKMKNYEKAVQSLIDTADAFEIQYHRFKDQKREVEERLAAWDVMADHVKDVERQRKISTATAAAKHEQAGEVVSTLREQFKEDNLVIQHAQSALRLGIEEWKDKMEFKAAYEIIGAVLGFVVSIAMLCTGSSSPPRVDKVIKAVEDAWKIGGEGRKVTSETLKKLASCVTVIYKLYPMIDKAVKALKALEENPDADVDKISDVVGGDADAAAIVSIAEWDNWILESDEQLEFAVQNNISGANEYRLALRRHAINAKALVLAQAEAIKAGQEYIHASLEQAASARDLERLDGLKKKWKEEKKLDDEAEAKFYDRFMSIRISIVVQMRNLTWAYKYAALEDSRVVLSTQKSAAYYHQDLSTIMEEVNTYMEKYPGGYTIMKPVPMGAVDLPAAFASDLVHSLKTTHTATFTFVPRSSNVPHDPHIAGPFTDGCHFRVVGLHVFLVGVVSKAHVAAETNPPFKLRVSTSGVYADIANDVGRVLQFTTRPLVNRPFEYSMEGDVPKVHVEPIRPSEDYSEPTPFTKWTITIKNPEVMDLDKLADIKLEWTAKYLPSTQRKARTA
ncbi:hypothetical protein CNMCM8980_002382 [Aspergillus fumigatiaffinis]|nr:hypothetical protein CNMCM8980_002382 [Aspergillus fumigatiaffinis]